jgi:hypothetical protein
MSFSFNKSEALANATDGEFAPIAPGVYTVQFQDLKEKETQSGGVQWSALIKITAGAKFVGRTFWINWNVVNQSEKAQEIARREIARIADLIGIGDDISIETMKTNAHFEITLEAAPEYMGKPQYNVKNWKLAGKAEVPKNFVTAASAKAEVTKTAAKKAQPWAVK